MSSLPSPFPNSMSTHTTSSRRPDGTNCRHLLMELVSPAPRWPAWKQSSANQLAINAHVSTTTYRTVCSRLPPIQSKHAWLLFVPPMQANDQLGQSQKSTGLAWQPSDTHSTQRCVYHIGHFGRCTACPTSDAMLSCFVVERHKYGPQQRPDKCQLQNNPG